MNSLPPRVEIDLSERMHDYWLARVKQHTADVYAGVPMSKFPEDLRVYEHLLWLSAPNVVIEIGTHFGGSALWFRDRLLALERYGRVTRPRVISIDLDQRDAHANLSAADSKWDETIALVEGDVREPGLPERLAPRLPAQPRAFVVEDSAHTYDTTLAALRGFSRFVSVGGFFVVEDGCVDVDEMRLEPDWPRGVLPALQDWLETPQGSSFVVRRDLELYGISCHPSGFLQRVAA